MLGYLVTLHLKAKTLLHHLKDMNLLHKTKRAKPLRKLWTSLRASTVDFAAMEVSNQFRRVFEVIDENGDGKISPSELSQVLVCLGYDNSVAGAEAEGMVKQMDCDGDGFVDLDEFMDTVVNHSVDSGDGRSTVDLMDAFLVFDADGNGKISAEELRRVLVGLGCDKCSVGECKKMIKGVDRDGDGFVDFEEFRFMMTNNKIR